MINTKKQIAQELKDLIIESKDLASIEVKETEIKAIFNDGSSWEWSLIGTDEWKFSLA
jgi:hypothetical protein